MFVSEVELAKEQVALDPACGCWKTCLICSLAFGLPDRRKNTFDSKGCCVGIYISSGSCLQEAKTEPSSV